jgi:hypothetical protein
MLLFAAAAMSACSLINPHVFSDRYELGTGIVSSGSPSSDSPTPDGPATQPAGVRESLRAEQNELAAALTDQLRKATEEETRLAEQDRALSTNISTVVNDLEALEREPATAEERKELLEKRADDLRRRREDLVARNKDTGTVDTEEARIAKELAVLGKSEATRPARKAALQTRELELRRERRTVRAQREELARERARLDLRLRTVQGRQDALTLSAARPPEEIPLDEAYRYSASVKQRYRDALGDQARLQSWLGLGLIPLSAAAIGLGAVGAGGNTVLALGLTGATALGAGTWLTNRSAQLAYIAGLKAVTCAEDAVNPLAVSAATRAELRLERQALEFALENYQTAVGVVLTRADSAEAAATDPIVAEDQRLRSLATALLKLITGARIQVAEGRSLVTSAEEALAGAAELDQAYSQAGRRLVIAVNRIADEVDGIIVQTQRDLSALSTIIGGLGAAYQTFTAVPDALKPSPERKPTTRLEKRELGDLEMTPLAREAEDRLHEEREKLVRAVLDFQQRLAALSAATRRVASRVNAVVKEAPLERLKRDCGVQAEGIVQLLTVDPAGPFTIEHAKGGTVSFTIRGGQTPYGAMLAGPPVTGLEVRQLTLWGPTVNVVVSKEVPANTYVINVYDGARQSKEVRVIVTPVTDNDAPPKDDRGGDGGLSRDLQKVTESLNSEPPTVIVAGVAFTVRKTARVDAGTRKIEIEVDMQPSTGRSGLLDEGLVADAVLGKAKVVLGLTRDHLRITNWSRLTLPPLTGGGGPLPATPPGSAAAPGGPAPSATETLFDDLDKTQRTAVQRALCLPPAQRSAKWDLPTVEGLKKFQAAQGLTPDGVLTRDMLDELLKMRDSELTQRCGPDI